MIEAQGKKRYLHYNQVIKAYSIGEMLKGDFNQYMRAGYTYKKLRKKFYKAKVSNEKLISAFQKTISNRFIEIKVDGKGLFMIA